MQCGCKPDWNPVLASHIRYKSTSSTWQTTSCFLVPVVLCLRWLLYKKAHISLSRVKGDFSSKYMFTFTEFMGHKNEDAVDSEAFVGSKGGNVGAFILLLYFLSDLYLLLGQIKKEYGNNVVPTFPPKKIFTLTPAEVEQRREQLEKYMQAGEISLLNLSFLLISTMQDDSSSQMFSGLMFILQVLHGILYGVHA